MPPMSIAEPPIAALLRGQRATGNGVHLVSRHYRKGTRLDTHMHREAQLVYAARGTMQVTTPKGRWLVPPDRAVWVPPRLEHSIDVLADIEMRTLYFDLAWLAREQRSDSLDAEFVVRVSPLLQETILALFDGRNDSGRTDLLIKLAVLELHHAEDATTFIPLPHEPRCRRAAGIVLGDPTAAHEIETLARTVGTSARRSSGCRSKRMYRSSNSPPISATPACRRFRTPSARSPARRRRNLRRRNKDSSPPDLTRGSPVN